MVQNKGNRRRQKLFLFGFNGATGGLDFAITSVPASVIYGQPTLPLLTNVDSAYYKAGKVKITVDNEAVVKIEKDSLQILKPYSLP